MHDKCILVLVLFRVVVHPDHGVHAGCLDGCAVRRHYCIDFHDKRELVRYFEAEPAKRGDQHANSTSLGWQL